MTTLVPFSPSNVAVPPFQATITLDGAQYSFIAKWNVYRSDWYYTISDQSGTVIYNAALVGSPIGADIYLAAGIFSTSTLLYRIDTGNLEINP